MLPQAHDNKLDAISVSSDTDNEQTGDQAFIQTFAQNDNQQTGVQDENNEVVYSGTTRSENNTRVSTTRGENGDEIISTIRDENVGETRRLTTCVCSLSYCICICENIYTQSYIEESRFIRFQQDQQYEASLHADEQKVSKLPIL